MSSQDNSFEIDFSWLDDYLDTPNDGNKDMDKQFAVMLPGNLNYKTYEDAEKDAKQKVGRNHQDYVIVKAIALANTPTPDVSVTKL